MGYRQQSALSDPLPFASSKNANDDVKCDEDAIVVEDNCDNDSLNDAVLKQMELIGYDMDKLMSSIKNRKHDHEYATYHLLKLRTANSINHKSDHNVAMIDKIIMKIKQKNALQITSSNKIDSIESTVSTTDSSHS